MDSQRRGLRPPARSLLGEGHWAEGDEHAKSSVRKSNKVSAAAAEHGGQVRGREPEASEHTVGGSGGTCSEAHFVAQGSLQLRREQTSGQRPAVEPTTQWPEGQRQRCEPRCPGRPCCQVGNSREGRPQSQGGAGWGGRSKKAGGATVREAERSISKRLAQPCAQKGCKSSHTTQGGDTEALPSVPGEVPPGVTTEDGKRPQRPACHPTAWEEAREGGFPLTALSLSPSSLPFQSLGKLIQFPVYNPGASLSRLTATY